MRTRQKSDACIVPEGGRKVVQSGGLSPHGGKARAVNQQVGQLQLPFVTAEYFTASVVEAVSRADGDLPLSATYAVPKAKDKEEGAQQATMEAVVNRLGMAFEKVASNKGAPGPDKQNIEQVRKHLPTLLTTLRAALLAGTYIPGDIRRVWIPKAGGGERGLGIPNVVDRMVQEALRGVLEPLWEPTFHPSSHGFRPGRSCHTAIAEAKRNVEEGYEWVVDMDLEKFFDRVHHQRLMARIAMRVQDRRLLELLGQMLKAAVVLPEGVRVQTEEGVPQGGPLSPLLSNIVLDELDWELAERGHRFVRYADDCNIFVRSERAGQRVMASIVDFISRRLRLKVNAAKSAVARPEERHFLGFSLRFSPQTDEVEVVLSKRSKDRLKAKIRELTPRGWGNTLDTCIQRLNAYLRGWQGFFGVCTDKKAIQHADTHIRRRLRAIVIRQWKRPKTIVRHFVALGVKLKTAWKTFKGRPSIWRMSHLYAADRALSIRYFVKRGLVLLDKEKWESTLRAIGALPEPQPPQQALFAGWRRS